MPYMKNDPDRINEQERQAAVAAAAQAVPSTDAHSDAYALALEALRSRYKVALANPVSNGGNALLNLTDLVGHGGSLLRTIRETAKVFGIEFREKAETADVAKAFDHLMHEVWARVRTAQNLDASGVPFRQGQRVAEAVKELRTVAAQLGLFFGTVQS